MVTEEEKEKLLKVETNSVVTNQSSLTKFIQVSPSFEQAYLNWLIDTYQPIVSIYALKYRFPIARHTYR